jgi:predicted regulator of Ras-like GTPase activity (Roadblock/LC7/MglB family)
MTHPLLAILKSLRDIEGVLGSFIWLSDGRLLASDVPESCPPETLEAVASRVQRLCDAFVSAGDRFDSTTLAFAQYKLHVCGIEGAFVGTVLASHVNMSALKMALTLARRELVAVLTDPVPGRASALSLDLGGEELEPTDREGARSYRGQRVPD